MAAALSQRVPVVERDGTPTAYLMRAFQALAVLPPGVTVERTSDTVLTFRMTGADGVTRTGTITLS